MGPPEDRPNSFYIDVMRSSAFLKDRSKKTYISSVSKILDVVKERSFHNVLFNPDKYGPLLEEAEIPDESKKTYLTTILTYFTYAEYKALYKEYFNKWYTYFLRVKKTIVSRVINMIPTLRQNEADVEWPYVLKCVDEMPKGGLDHLLMSLITLLPPRRQMDWARVRVYTQPDFKPEKADHNYITLYYNNPSPFILLSEYKTYKFFGKWYKKLEDPLLSLIRESIKMYPREWLFVNSKGNPFTVDTFTVWSNRIIKRVVKNEKTSMNSLRHSFVTYIYRANRNMSLADIYRYSRDMGHSPVQQMGYKLSTEGVTQPELSGSSSQALRIHPPYLNVVMRGGYHKGHIGV